MGGACLNGGGTLDEMLIGNVGREEVSRFPELINFKIKDNFVSVFEYNEFDATVRTSLYDKNSGRFFFEEITINVDRSYVNELCDGVQR